VPRDTASSFPPQIVLKRQRRLTGVDEIVLSLTAKGLTTGEVSAHGAWPRALISGPRAVATADRTAHLFEEDARLGRAAA